MRSAGWTSQYSLLSRLFWYQFTKPVGIEGLAGMVGKSGPRTWIRVHVTADPSDCVPGVLFQDDAIIISDRDHHIRSECRHLGDNLLALKEHSALF